MICKVCFFGPKKMRFMQTESVLQTKNRSGPAKNRFSVAMCPSIYPSDLASIRPSSHTESHTRRQGRTHACTHMCTCKSTHLLILCPSRPSVACIHTRTFRHAHIYAYIHAYSRGPVTQLAARQICNLSSVKGS